MIDWGLVAKIWAGYGVNIIVLVILLGVVWIVGLAVQRLLTRGTKGPKKE
jgi:Na+-transporting methylmalonyl-CoA/oxaloacetate decarboxylase gamma subunit